MAQSRRLAKVQREALRILGRVLLNEISDERLKGVLLSFTRTRVSADLSYLDVWVSIQGEERHQRGLLAVIERAKGFLRRRLGEELQLRIVPEIRLHLDQSLDHAERVEDILDKIAQERRERERALEGTSDRGSEEA